MGSQTRSLLILLLGVSFLLLIADRGGVVTHLRSLGDIITLPLGRVVYQIGTWVHFNRDDYIHTLERQNSQLTILSAKNQELEEENKALKKQIEGHFPKSKTLVIAHPIGIERYLRIDRGEADGIKVGNTVISEGALVGKVKSVSTKTAFVMVPTDPDSKIPAWTPKLTRGIVFGSFGRSLAFDQIFQGESIEVGDVVSTTGEEGYLQNTIIGKIVSLNSEARNVYKNATVAPLLDFKNLRAVYVVLD